MNPTFYSRIGFYRAPFYMSSTHFFIRFLFSNTNVKLGRSNRNESPFVSECHPQFSK